MRIFYAAVVLFVGLAGAARAEGYPELSCFSGPTYVENYYQNWDFTNNCPFAVTVHFSHVSAALGINDPNATVFVAPCSSTRFQTIKAAKVDWGTASFERSGGQCLNGKLVKGNDEQSSGKGVVVVAPGGAGGGAAEASKSTMRDMLGEQQKRNEAAQRKYSEAMDAVDADQVAAEAALKAKVAEKEAAERREAEVRAADEARAKAKAAQASSTSASGFDIGLCDRIEYDHYGPNGDKLQILCWRRGYTPNNSDPYDTCDETGPIYNGALALNCKLGN